jgi:hypothetical protein
MAATPGDVAAALRALMPDAEIQLRQVDDNALGIRDIAVVRLPAAAETWVDLTTSIEGAAVACWALVHGFAELHLNGPMREIPAELRDPMLEGIFDVIQPGLVS